MGRHEGGKKEKQTRRKIREIGNRDAGPKDKKKKKSRSLMGLQIGREGSQPIEKKIGED